MRAVAVPELGAEPRLVGVDVPAPAPGEVVVEVAGAGLDPVDWQMADGTPSGQVPHIFPMVLGEDFAGTATATGDGVTRFAVGDAVFGQTGKIPLGAGTYAEDVTIPADGTVAPTSLALGDAAAVPMAGQPRRCRRPRRPGLGPRRVRPHQRPGRRRRRGRHLALCRRPAGPRGPWCRGGETSA
ncbi:alcohol dehydrogenase catalytic domain-containing protein [Embleya sp. NPDC020630]|uniref:alcohol dehydrogenase catalytic domain-containing protein n=1 Tax=Embleya sp. NPDC020630 TaxID=3363979 RepID=UPI0037A2427B